MRRPPYLPVPDNAAFSRSRFHGAEWWFWLENLQHLVATRGRVVVNERFLDVSLATGALAEVARFVVDAAPMTDTYWYRLGFSAELDADFHGFPVSARVRVDSEDTAAASAKTGDYAPTFTLRPRERYEAFGNPDEAIRAQGLFLVRWPFTEGRVLPEVFTPWLPHTPASPAVTQGLVFIVNANKVAVWAADVDVYLRSVTIVGGRGAATNG